MNEISISSFKCDKAIGEIKFESSGLKGIDTKSLSYLPNVEKMSFATNLIEKLSPGGLMRSSR